VIEAALLRLDAPAAKYDEASLAEVTLTDELAIRRCNGTTTARRDRHAERFGQWTGVAQFSGLSRIYLPQHRHQRGIERAGSRHDGACDFISEAVTLNNHEAQLQVGDEVR